MSAFAAALDKVPADAREVASSVLVISRDANGEVHFEAPNDNSIDPRISGLGIVVGVYVYDLDKNHVRVSIQNVGLD